MVDNSSKIIHFIVLPKNTVQVSASFFVYFYSWQFGASVGCSTDWLDLEGSVSRGERRVLDAILSKEIRQIGKREVSSLWPRKQRMAQLTSEHQGANKTEVATKLADELEQQLGREIQEPRNILRTCQRLETPSESEAKPWPFIRVEKEGQNLRLIMRAVPSSHSPYASRK